MLTSLLCRVRGHRWDWRMSRDAEDRTISYFECMRCGQLNELTKDVQRRGMAARPEERAAPGPVATETEAAESQPEE